MATSSTNSNQQDTDFESERVAYIEFLQNEGAEHGSTSSASRHKEELKMAPLFSMSIKQAVLQQNLGEFSQYALLGHVIPMPFMEATDDLADKMSEISINESAHESTEKIDPVLLNTDTPWSAFICGSQGSGKSHTMSCILENCLLPETRIGKLDEPLAGIVFHFDSMDSNHCEAAHLCSRGIPIRVLVSPSNFSILKDKYARIPGAANNITVEPLYLQDEHLNTERIKRLMAFGDDSEHPPLYMGVTILPPPIQVSANNVMRLF